MFLQGAEAALENALVDAFYATAALMLGLLASGYAISSALRPRGEEDAGRVEALLATALPRRRWLLGHVTITVAGTVAMLLAAGLGLAVGYGLVTGDTGTAVDLAPPVLAYVAPVLVLSGFARLLVGVNPRLGVLAWLPLLLAVVVMLFGELLRLPDWFQALSPFEHLALVPLEEFRWAPVLVLLALAAALSAAGQVAFARRDLR
jgi:ABC-2 type transport system permease protein